MGTIGNLGSIPGDAPFASVGVNKDPSARLDALEKRVAALEAEVAQLKSDESADDNGTSTDDAGEDNQ